MTTSICEANEISARIGQNKSRVRFLSSHDDKLRPYNNHEDSMCEYVKYVMSKNIFHCLIDTYCIEGEVRRLLIKVHTSLVTFLILIQSNHML